MSFVNHYQVLNVSMQATVVEIKKAYRRQAQKYHPDTNANDENATVHFQKIQTAYETLSKPEKRRAFDLQLLKSDAPLSFGNKENDSTADILKQSKSLLQFLKTQNYKSINSDALTDYLLALLNNANTQIILETASTSEKEELCRNILVTSKSIISAKLFAQIAERITLIIPAEDIGLKGDLEKELTDRNQKEKLNKLVPFAALGIILLIILAMWAIIAPAKK